MKNAAEVSGIDDTGAKEEPYLEMRIRQTSDSNECIPVRLYGNVAAHQAVLETRGNATIFSFWAVAI